MTKTDSMARWIETSRALSVALFPATDGDLSSFGAGVDPKLFTRIVETAEGPTDNALLELAGADGEQAAKKIAANLPRHTVIALRSRWVHYHHLWMEIHRTRQPHWVPDSDVWRAILLSMVSDRARMREACARWWPEDGA